MIPLLSALLLLLISTVSAQFHSIPGNPNFFSFSAGVDYPSAPEPQPASLPQTAPPSYLSLLPPRHEVTSLPGWSAPLLERSYSGYLPVSTDPSTFVNSTTSPSGYQCSQGELFYFLQTIRPDNALGLTPADAPTLLFLEGGPGCAGSWALFAEFGSYLIDAPNSLKANPASWNKLANLLVIDAPLGTGLSPLDPQFPGQRMIANQSEWQTQMYAVLYNFYQLFPELAKNPLYLIGDSYSGRWIPELSYYIYWQNEYAASEPSGGLFQIPLSGLAIGNGWIDPLPQLEAANFQLFILGYLTTAEFQRSQNDYSVCKQAVQAAIQTQNEFGEPSNATITAWLTAEAVCDAFNSAIVNATGPGDDAIMVDDVRYQENADYENPPETLLDPYFSSAAFQAATLAKPTNYSSCSDDVDNAFLADEMKSSIPVLSTVLKAYNSILYLGNFDYTCGGAGGEAAMRQFITPQLWDSVEKHFWYSPASFNGTNLQLSGHARNFASVGLPNFTFLIFYNAGHLTPMTQPMSAFDLVRRLTQNLPFESGPQHVEWNVPQTQFNPQPLYQQQSHQNTPKKAAEQAVQRQKSRVRRR